MDEPPVLAALSASERDQALGRFRILQPFLEGQATLTAVAREHDVRLRTAQRWVRHYQQYGLVGLARKRRSDRHQRRMGPELRQLIEGLALQKVKPTAAAIHRQVTEIAHQRGWKVASYACVHDIVRSLDPALVKLAHGGTKAYQQSYDLLYRREASRPNDVWQADHSLLDLWLLCEDTDSARPWLTVIEDDYSRSIAGYFLSFKHPNILHTSLALRQAIWRKTDRRWHICGIPEILYTDNGGDFISHHMEQVSADLKMQLVFSTPGMPRGRGRVERLFQTLNQLLLHQLPGYGPEGKPLTKPSLTLPAFDEQFRRFLLEEYHQRVQKEMQSYPQERWEANGFLPQMPASLEQLDLLLLTSATTRRVRRDGIHFQNLRYMDVNLAAYIGEDVVIRYDPRDMAEIRVYHQDQFFCRAVCQELSGQVISLQDIIRARNRRRRELKKQIGGHAQLVQTYLDVHQADKPEPPKPGPEPPPSKKTRLKRYYNE